MKLLNRTRAALVAACGVLSMLGAAQAQTIAASASLVVKGVRPEAFSWFWDNADAGLLSGANPDNKSFNWVLAPATPQHLGYSSGAVYTANEVFGGKQHTVVVTYLDPATVATRVASDNFLGSKPYSFVAQSVSVDGKIPFQLLIQYTPTGTGFTDSDMKIEAAYAADPATARDYVDHVAKTMSGLSPTLTAALNERYFNAILKTRGFYKIGPVDKNFNVTLTITQEIKGINTDMLAWWWDHIGNTARYRLWQPIDHVSFEWTVPPVSPDMQYDIGAVQKVKEYIGKNAQVLTIKGADPSVTPPPVALTDPNYFYAATNLTLLQGILPNNSLVHQWHMNAAGDGVILTSTFVNTALARVIDWTFFEDLGNHCLREFQMMPYFLPRLYKREQLHL